MSARTFAPMVCAASAPSLSFGCLQALALLHTAKHAAAGTWRWCRLRLLVAWELRSTSKQDRAQSCQLPASFGRCSSKNATPGQAWPTSEMAPPSLVPCLRWQRDKPWPFHCHVLPVTMLSEVRAGCTGSCWATECCRCMQALAQAASTRSRASMCWHPWQCAGLA